MREQKQQDVDRHQKKKKNDIIEICTRDTHIIDREKRDNGKQDKAE